MVLISMFLDNDIYIIYPVILTDHYTVIKPDIQYGHSIAITISWRTN